MRSDWKWLGIRWPFSWIFVTSLVLGKLRASNFSRGFRLQLGKRRRRAFTRRLLWTAGLLLGLGGLAAHAEVPPQTEDWVLEVPLRALPLEALLPAPEKLGTEKGDSGEACWELIPIESLPSKQTPSATSPQFPLSVLVQIAPGLASDGQIAENRRQLAIQIADNPSSPQKSTQEKNTRGEKSSPAEGAAETVIRYRLQKASHSASAAFQFKEVSPASLGLWEGQGPVLVYNHGPITNETVPQKDHRRTRACYVHPLYGLRGEVLTEDFPKDHYHHHGLFWAWPHIVIEGKEHDLWAGATIRQEFVRWLARLTGPVCAVLGVENGWYVGSKKVMVERIWFWVYRADAGKHRTLDIALYLEPTDQPVTLWGAPEKSYGGLTVRFAPSSRSETEITVPTGRTTDDLLDTRLKWADFTSKMLGSPFRSGAAIMIHPQHPDYPPTWLTRHYGAMCVGWPGIRPKTLHPGQPVRLCYRLWIHPQPVSFQDLTAAYEAFCAGVEGSRWTQRK